MRRRTTSIARAAAAPVVSGVVSGGIGMSAAAALHLASLSTAAMMLPWPIVVGLAVARQTARLRKASSKADFASSDNVSKGT